MSTTPRIPSAERRGFTLAALARGSVSTVVVLLLALLAALPLVQVVARELSRAGIRGSDAYLQHLVLWVAFAGSIVTAREGRHLSLSVASDRLPRRVQRIARAAASAVSGFVGTVLTFASLGFAAVGFSPSARAGAIPVWILVMIMPLSYAAVTVRLVARAAAPLEAEGGTTAAGGGRSPAASGGPGAGSIAALMVALVGVLLGIAWSLSAISDSLQIAATAPGALGRAAQGLGNAASAGSEVLAPIVAAAHLPLIALILMGTLLGAPIFVLLGGLAVLLFLHGGGPLEVIPNQAYTMLSRPVIPALPLFTLAGYIISESKAGERLVRLFRGLLGWLPGGLAIMSVVICAFLTTFTGASGVTILVVGSLLLFVLTEGRLSRSFSSGLLTAAGSVGLLFPPSLPVILYGVVAQVSIEQLFVGGILPGVFLVLTLAALGIRRSIRDKVPRVPFDPAEALRGLGASVFEVLLPVLILVLFLRGIMTLVETAAFSVAYVLVVEVVIHRDIPVRRLPEVFLKGAVVVGGVLTILAVANGLSYYTVDAQIPSQLAAWLRSSVASKYLFLLILNLSLLVVGAFMDIFSAITVVAPLVIPMAAAYGINPVHLGIIFLANLELGYLAPPVGLNLQFASYRFAQPMATVVRNVLPFLVVQIVAVLVITYVPGLTTVLLPLTRR
ncbi:MAG TPA: TRAP transporter large permease subunit [Spirochaetia bacterium]|nr:TRAP transporter large permease subunit [Spirochaetia bacterium]